MSQEQLKRMFLLHQEDEDKLNIIQQRFSGNRSDIVRRSIGVLYDYLIEDKLPGGDFVPMPDEVCVQLGLDGKVVEQMRMERFNTDNQAMETEEITTSDEEQATDEA